MLRTSLLYETAPMHVTDQAPFINAALLASTDLPPLQLLYGLKQVRAGGQLPLARAFVCLFATRDTILQLDWKCSCCLLVGVDCCSCCGCCSARQTQHGNAIHAAY